MNLNTPDLTVHPPRSPRVRLGGYVILPRIIDKGRATSTGKTGEYKFGCPLDQQFLQFVGIDTDTLCGQIVAGKSDNEILEWISANAVHVQSAEVIAQWSRLQEERVPADPDSRDFFNTCHRECAPGREDIRTWFDLLDLDDFCSFGGRP